MTVYVDHARIPYRGMRMNHLLCDGDLAELHAMAVHLGVRRWFQDHDIPHYDICLAKRALAIQAGAVEIDRRETARLVRFWKARTAASDQIRSAADRGGYLSHHEVNGHRVMVSDLPSSL